MIRIQGLVCLVVLILVAASTSESVAQDSRTDPMGGTGGGPIDGSLHVRVIHIGTTDPLVGAFVMAGQSDGDPFAGNWGLTDANGEITLADPNLQGPIAVTAGAASYRYFTLVHVDAADLVIPLSPIVSTDPEYEVGDFVSGIDVDDGWLNSGDGYVDLALVLPTLKLEELMTFDMGNLMGPPETIEILGQPFDVPSNVFIPQQWELFIEIIKDHYYLYLSAGDYTIGALSARIDRDDLLAGGDIADLIPNMEYREIDILDVSVSGNIYTADLNVAPDLNETVTLNVANIPDNSKTWCVSLGDLDALEGLGRLVPLGLNSINCPGGSGYCEDTVHLTTTAATGEFAGMTYFSAVAVQINDQNDMVAIMDRAPRPQTYTANVASFFHLLELGYAFGEFAWNDATNPGTGSPDVHLQMAQIGNTGNDEVYWEFTIPGGVYSFTPPSLPAEAPPGPVPGTEYAWEHVAVGLGYELSSFDFNDFALSDVIAHGSHIALDETQITFHDPTVGVSGDGVPSVLALRGSVPNPFKVATTIGFDLPNPMVADLTVYGVDGRRVTTLASRFFVAGHHDIQWLGRDSRGLAVPSGVYWARLRTDGWSSTSRIVLQR